MKKRRLMKAAVLAMLLAMAGSGIQAAGVGNQKLTLDASVSDAFDYQVAAGNLASTAGNYATAYGYLNYASGNYSTAFGSGSTSEAGNYQNSALGLYSTAIGYANTATVGRSTAIGYRNEAIIDYGTAVGVYNLAKGMYGTAVGYGSSTTGNYSTAVGNKASASGEYSTSIGAGDDGTTNSASGRYSSAFGYKNTAGTDYAQAFGTSNTASAKAASSIVMGTANTVDGENSNAFGYHNQAGSARTMSIGSQNLTTGEGATTIGLSNVTNQENAMAIGVGNTAAGSNAMATGQNNAASGAYAFAEGRQNISGFTSAVSQVGSQYTTAIGFGNTATGAVGAGVTPGRTVALGDSNYVIVNDSVTLGQDNKIRNGERSVAFGYQNTLNEDGKGIAAAFGGNNTVDSEDTTHPAAAFGYLNETKGIAVGYKNVGEKKKAQDQGGTDVYPVAIGSENEDSGIGSFNTGSGIGYKNTVNLDDEEATFMTANGIGTQNIATKAAAIAIGYMNEAGGAVDKPGEGGNSNAIGVLNVAAGTNSGAFGYRNYVGAENAIAMGAGNNMASYNTTKYTAAVTGAYSVAVGFQNNAQSANSTAFGYGNIANSASVEGGSKTATDGASAVFGAKNQGSGNDSVALGYGNTTGKSIKTTSIGGEAGTTFHTVAIGNANTATGYITIEDTSDKTRGNTVAVGYKNTASGNYAKAFGVSNVVYANESSAFGYGNQILNYSTGYSTNYNGYQSSALGVSNVVGYSSNYSYYRGQRSTAVGVENKVYSQLSMAAGYSNTLGNGQYNSVFGVGNTTTFSYSSSGVSDQNTIVGFSNKIKGTYNSADYYPDYNTILGGENEIHYRNTYISVFGRNNKVGYESNNTIFMGYGNQRDDYSYTNNYYYQNLGYLGTGNTVAHSDTSTSGSYQYLIGSNNQMYGSSSIGVGYDNYVNGNNGGQVTTVGVGNEWAKDYTGRYANNSTFLGINNGYSGSANRYYLQYIGIDNGLIASYSTVLGQNNSGSGDYANALGKGNVLSGADVIAVGFSNTFSQSGYNSSYNTAIGTGNISGGTTYYSSNGYWYNNNSTAVGSANQAKGLNTSAFGYGNKVGSTSTGGDNRGHVTTYSAAIGANNTVRSAGTYYNGTNYTENQKGLRSYALGADNITQNNDSTALGYGNTVGGTYTGSNTLGTNYTNYNLALGVGNEAGGTFYGENRYYTSDAQYNSYNTTAVGFENRVTGQKNTAVGYDNVISGLGDVASAMNQGRYRVDSSAAVGRSNVVKAAAAMQNSYTTSYYAGGQGSYALGHDNVTQAPYSTAIGASNTVGGTRAYNKGQQGDAHLDNTALGTGNTVGDGTYQDSFTADDGQGTQYRAFNTYSGTGIGFQNTVGSNYVTAAGYHNTIANADKSAAETDLGLYTVTYSAALGQENEIHALGETNTSDLDQRVLGGEYSYAIGYGNQTKFAGSTALGFGNVVGAATAARSVLSGSNGYFNANTAIGTGNTVGGLFVTDADGKTYQVSYATGIGVSNEVYGEEGTAIGASNWIEGSRNGHQNKDEKNRSAALGSRNTIQNTLDFVGTSDTLYDDVYNYALGTDNEVSGAGNLAVGHENIVGGNVNKQETADAANTAIGANNDVGGTYDDAEYGTANGRYNLAAGFGNYAIGQENTAIGIQNTIAENVGTLSDSTNSTQHNVLVGILNTVSNATYTAPRMYNVGIGEGNTFRNGYDTAIGFYNTVGGALATNVDNTETMYHVAIGSQNTVAGTNGTANGMRMTAVGSENTTYGRDSVAIGKSSVTGTEDQENDTRESAAIGVRAVASSMKSLAVGVDVTASTVTGAVAVGQKSTVSGEKSSAFGVNNQVSGTESLALGTDNDDVFGNRTIVIGSGNTSAVTTGAGASDEMTTGTNGSVIFGVDSTVTGDRGIAFGVQDTAAGGSVAAGYESSALGEHSLAMGYAQTVTATGAHGTAVGSGYERTEGSAESQTTYYYGTTVSGVSGAAFGVANLVSGNYATAVGAGYYRHTEISQQGVDYFFQNTAAGDYSAAFGYLNSAEGEHSLAAGTGFVETVDDIDTVYANIAKRANSAALGYANQALAEESLAAGGFSRTGADATGGTAVGEGYVVDITDSSGTTTERRYNEATGVGATALGFANKATGAASTAAGFLSKASAANATALGAGILKETKDGTTVTAVEYIENEATAEGATAIGYANSASGQWSTALGALSKATGVGATAAGAGYTKNDGTLVYNEADGDGAVAYGYANIARGNNATAIGSTITVGTERVNQALSEGSTAIGAGNTAGATDKDKATAIGVTNLATGNESLAIGVSNEAISDAAIFLGNRNVTTVTVGGTAVKSGGQNAIALGSDNQVAGNYGSALGTSNVVYGDYDVVIGSGASTGATGAYRVAMGYQAQATGDKSIAIGYQAQAQAANSIAFGTNAQATFANSVAIGTDSVSTDSRRDLEKTLEAAGTRTTYTVSFGNSTTVDNVTTGIVSRLTNVAEGRETKDTSGKLIAGVGDTDAINVKQLKRYINTVPVFYDHRDTNASPFTAEGSYITTNDHWLSTDFWQENVTHGKDSTAYGYLANAKGETSSALGYNATTEEDAKDAIAMAGGTVTGAAGIAIGNGASAATGAAIGTGAISTGSSYAIGTDATASGTNVMVLGKGSTSTGEEYTISVGNGTDNYRIVNLADAQIDKTAADYDATAAVNVETMKQILDTMPEQEAIVIFDDGLNGRGNWGTTQNHWVGTDFDLTGIAHGTDSTGYGYATAASGQNSTAVGYGYKDGSGTIHYNTATANYASAFGTANTAGGLYALAAGIENTASGAYSAAVGYTSEATAAKATSIGYSTQAKGENSTAIGNYAIAYSKDSIAIGTAYHDTSSGTTMQTQAVGEGATAIGLGAVASGDRALSLGAYQNAAIGTDTVALGAVNAVYGDRSAAFGVQNAIGAAAAPAAKSYALGILNTVTGAQATALGYDNTVSADYGTAAGFGSSVVGARGFAAGVNAAATQDAAAVGSFAVAAADSSTAVGAQAYATAENSAAIGYQATAVDSRVADDGPDAKINTVSFGHKATDIDPTTGAAYGTALTSHLTHIADGVSDTDAANVRQLKESVIVDFDATYASGGGKWLSTDFGYEEKFTHGENSTAYGYRANAVGDASVALGYQAYTASENGVALGAESVATGAVVSVGHKKDDQYQYIDPDGNVATGTYEDALTRRITNVDEGTGDYDLVNVAQAKKAMKTAGIVKWDGVDGTDGEHYLATYFGDKDYYTPGENSSAYGYLTKATGEGSTAFAYAAQALADDGVALGAYSVANDNVISLGHAATDINPETNAAYGSELTRKIIHVADGTKDTDLVNVRTMKLTDPVKSGTDGTNRWVVTSDTETVSYTPGTNATAYGLSSQALGNESTAIGYGTVVNANAASGSVAIGANSVAERVFDAEGNPVAVVSVGGKTTETAEGTVVETRRITNVADGITDKTAANYTGTDLVTYGQLKLATAEGGIVDYDIHYKEPGGGKWLSTNFGETGTNAENSASFGYASKVSAARGAALGYNASVTVADGVAIGADSVASVEGTVSVGHTTSDTNPLTGGKYTDNLTRIITGLAFGADDTDAVSVAQLKYTDPVKTGTTATATGGENHYLTTLDPTTYTPGENSVAYGLGTGQAKGAYASGKQAVAFGFNAFAPAENAVALGAGSYAGEKNTVSLGHKTTDFNRETGSFYTEDLNRKITGVADAVWDENSDDYNDGTDLVNVKVLRVNTQDAPGIVRTIGDNHNLYTELNDSGKVNPAEQAVAYGKQAYAKAENSVALGYKSYAGVAGGVALGSESVASEAGTVSVGHKAGDTYYDYDENGNYVTKEYEGALLRRVTGLAFGVENSDAVSVAQLKLTDPVKTGTTDGVADTNHWLATPMGGTTFARGENSVAYGYATAATAKNTVAFGYAALAQQENAVAIGADSVAKSEDTVSFGHRQGDTKQDRSPYESDLERRIIHVADGVADTDLINVSQLEKQVDSIQVIDWDKNREADGQKWLSTDFGKTVTHGYGSTAYGNYANAKNSLSAALGYAAVASADNSVALGQYSTASQVNTVSVGHTTNDTNPLTGENYTDNLTRRITNVATGTAETDLVNKAQLEFTDPIKTGTTGGQGHWLATDMGSGINGTPGMNSAAYGFETKASGESSVAIGYRAVATGSGSVALGALSAAADDNVVSVGHQSNDLNYKGQKFMDTLTRRIVNVKAGREDVDPSTGKYVYGNDLVTVAQLNRAAATSGGVVEFNGDYATANDYYLSTYIATDGGATHNATSAAYGYKANVATDATNGAALGYGASVTAANATAIGAESVADEENTISVGAADAERRITNVADGVTDTTADNYNDGTDALTVGQLHQYYLPKSGTDEEGNTWIATTYGSPIEPGKNSAAYGDGAAAKGEASVALGNGAVATDKNSVAIGAGSTSAGENTVSVGDAESGLYRRITNVAAGRDDVDADGNYIYGNDAVNYGQLKEILEEKGVGVVKYDTKYAEEEDPDHRLTTVFEDEEEAGTGKISAKDAMAYGYQADASYEKAVAFGAGATAGFESSVALGAGSVVYEANTVSVGDAQNGLTRRITNVKAGVADTDMINVSQLNTVKDILAINGIKENSTTTVKDELDAFTGGVETFKQDVDTFAGKVDTFQGDVDTFQGDVDTFADDVDKTKENLNNQGITADSNISEKIEEIDKKLDDINGGATRGTEIDPETGATKYKDNQTAVGSGSAVDGKESSVFGYRDQVTGENSTGMGTTNIVTGDKSTGIGSENHIDGDRSSAYGFDNHVTGNDALAIGSGNEARGDGTVAIGQGAWAKGDNGVAIGTGAEAVKGSVAIGAGSKATESGTVSFGDGTNNRRLTNIAESDVETDVATYKSVKDLQSRVDAIDTTTGNVAFDRLDSMIDNAEKNISKVGAGAAAIAALHPLEFDPSEKVSFAIGYGNYQGESAMAIGAFVRPNESITLSLGGAMGNGDNLLNSSISFALGAGPSGLAARSKAALAKQVNEQDEKIAARDEEIARLRSLISQLEAMAETEEQKAMAHEMVIRSEAAELEELRSMAQQLVATASADQLRSIIYQLSPGGV